MRKRWILWGGGVVLVYLMGVAVYVVFAMNRVPDLHSSPTETRDTPEYNGGSLGILKKARRSVELEWPASLEIPTPEILYGEDEAGGFLVDWGVVERGEEEAVPNPWVTGLQGDEEIDLVAFASWVPEPDDDVSADADWLAEPVFRDAKTLDRLTAEELDQLGVSEAFRKLAPPKRYRTPKLRLLFRSRNMEQVRFIGGGGGDSRTQAAVTYDLDRLGEAEKMSAQEGDWTRVDFALLLWHDTPVKLHLRLLTGELEERKLEQVPGEQVVFGDRLRVQWVHRVSPDDDDANTPSDFSPSSKIPEAERQSLAQRLSEEGRGLVWMRPDEDDAMGMEPRSKVMVRVNSQNYLQDHCGRIRQDGSVDWYWDWVADPDEIDGELMMTESDIPAETPMRLVFLPSVTELTFELPGLPDLPNPREIEDLWDVKIPRLTLPEDPESAEDQLLSFVSVAAEIEWDIRNLWEANPPAELPADRTFRNQSPQELLAWYRKVTPGSRIRYDEEAKAIYFNQEETSLWERFKNWVMGWRYFF